MHKNESMEDYLERILMLHETSGNVRAIDIATDMGYSKPSVSIALKKLKALNYIEIKESGSILLTDSGRIIAKKVYDRHKLLKNALISLGVSGTQASIDACLLEHDLSEESFDKLKCYIEKINKA